MLYIGNGRRHERHVPEHRPCGPAGRKERWHVARVPSPGIIEAPHRMPAVTEPLIRRQEGARQRIYQRFFGERVFVDSLLSYTSRRLRFFLLSATPA